MAEILKYQLTQTGNEVQDLLDNIPIGKFRLVGFTLTDTTNFAVQSMVLYKMGNMRMLAMSLSTKTSLATGNYAIGTIDNASDRPQFTVSNFIARQDSGSQGIGTITVNSNGSVYYGVDIAGVSGVTIVTQVTWFTY